MFKDRDFLRSRVRFRAQGSVTSLLILANLLVYILENVVDCKGLEEIYQRYALSIDGLRHGQIWQLITAQFLHAPVSDGGVFHLLGNLFCIYLFGRGVEAAIGGARFLGLYLVSGAAGGLLQMAGGAIWPEQFGVAVAGASAGACGLIAAFALIDPHRPVWMFFLPVSIQAWKLLTVALVVSVIGLAWPGRSTGTAHAAHLGGLAAGMALVCWRLRKSPVSLLLEGGTRPAPGLAPVLE